MVPKRAGEEAHHVAKEEGRVAGADGTEGIDSAETVDMELGHMVEAGGGVVGHGVDVKIASGKAAAVDVGGEDVELTAEEAEEDGTSGDVDSGAVEAEEDAGVVGRYELVVVVVVVVRWKNRQGQGFAATCRAGDRQNSLRFAIDDKVIENWCRV